MTQWQQLNSRYSNLQPREKSLIFYGLLILTLWLGIMYVLEPTWKNLQQSERQQRTVQAQITEAERQAEQLKLQLASDINSDFKQQITQLQQQQQALNEQISLTASHFVGAEQMITLLQDVLSNSKGVQLKALTTSEAQPVRLAGQPVDEASVLFRHTTTLVVSGRYQQLYAMLQRIEQLPWLLNWAALDYQVTTHPQADMTLQLITVSEYEDFIRL